jgi:peptidoglycan-N-acetylglucosamine deacetylase
VIEMKKTLVFIIAILAAGFASYTYCHNTNLKAISSRNPVSPGHPIVYDIRGESERLTPKERKDLQKARIKEALIAKKNPSVVYINGYTDKKICALTFDDGPDGTVMPKILDILKKNGVSASFFLIGNQVNAYKDIVKKASAEGNLMLNHSFTHPDFFKLNANSINKQILDTEDVIYNVIGRRPAIFRPPYGSLNDTIISTSKALGYHIAIWSTDSMDWSQKEKDNIIKNVLDNIRPGEIIIMHCGPDKEATADALPIVISELRNKGYTFTTLDKLLNIRAYK